MKSISVTKIQKRKVAHHPLTPANKIHLRDEKSKAVKRCSTANFNTINIIKFFFLYGGDILSCRLG